MTKMVMIIYNEAMDEEVMETLRSCAVKNYTKINGAYGSGSASGTHMGSDIWPGKNNILYAGCEEKEAQLLLAGVKELRKKLAHEGVKAFMFAIESVT